MDSVDFPTAVLILLTVLVIFLAVNVVMRWNRANQQPIETLPALVVAKRAHVWGGSGSFSTSTTYYATFELSNGERCEFVVPNNIYGLLAEGDQGQLRVQGGRFKGYDRLRQPLRAAE
jgi:hypothetical protein